MWVLRHDHTKHVCHYPQYVCVSANIVKTFHKYKTFHWSLCYYVLQFCRFPLNWESLLCQQYISRIPHISNNERIENFQKNLKFILASQVPSASNCAEVCTILIATFVTSFNFVLFCTYSIFGLMSITLTFYPNRPQS